MQNKSLSIDIRNLILEVFENISNLTKNFLKIKKELSVLIAVSLLDKSEIDFKTKSFLPSNRLQIKRFTEISILF